MHRSKIQLKEAEPRVFLKPLGQVGYCFNYLDTILYIDPYLSDSVKEFEDENMERMFPILYPPESITNANFILITHEHRDHCDPETLIPISKSSPQCQFIGPNVVVEKLKALGLDSSRLRIAPTEWTKITTTISIKSIPSSHPIIKSDHEGNWIALGYLVKFGNKLIYHAGDTSVDPMIINSILSESKVDVGFIPVNEKNYYREANEIIGNMSIREAFEMAQSIGVNKFVPTHWDMFYDNSVYREEIELLYSKITPDFELVFYPSEI